MFNQLRHHGEVRYFALKTGHEIDFVLDGKLALEAKETPTLSDEEDLKKLARLAGVKKTCFLVAAAMLLILKIICGAGKFYKNKNHRYSPCSNSK